MNSTQNISLKSRRTVKLMLLANMMESECFEVLRTKEALGYIVSVSRSSYFGKTNNVDYLVLEVASDHVSANVLHQRVDLFLTHYFDHVLMPMMGEGESTTFQLFVNGTVGDLEQKEVRLSQHTALLWSEIKSHQYRFEWKREFVQILRTLTVREMVAFYKEHVLGQNAKWISIQIFHQNEGRNNTGFGHQIIVNQTDEDSFLYFNDTKELQRLANAQYYVV